MEFKPKRKPNRLVINEGSEESVHLATFDGREFIATLCNPASQIAKTKAFDGHQSSVTCECCKQLLVA